MANTTDQADEQTLIPGPTPQYESQSWHCGSPLHPVHLRRLPQHHTVQAARSHVATMPSPAMPKYQLISTGPILDITISFEHTQFLPRDAMHQRY